MKKAHTSANENVTTFNAVKAGSTRTFSPATLSPARSSLAVRAKSISSSSKPLIQPKLKIGTTDDKYEQEADRVAEQVIQMPGPMRPSQEDPPEEGMIQTKPLVNSITPYLQRQANDEEEDEIFIQEKTSGAVTPKVTPLMSSTIHSLKGRGKPLLDSERSFFEPRFGVDLSTVRVHDNTQAASAARLVDARAFTMGQDVVFGAGEYSRASLEARKLLAHELTHVVQQRKSHPGSILQRRRVPRTTSTLDLVWRENAAAHSEGLIQIVNRAWRELTKAQRTAVLTRARGTMTEAQFKAMSRTDRYVFYAHAIRQEVPGLIHGDPSLYQVGARTGTNDAANIITLVGGANAIFTAIAAGTHDTSVGQIFGTTHVATAKARYAAARTRMNFLKTQDKIVTDRSGYSGEVGLGGLTNSAQIMVSPDIIDNPGEKESIVTMIHEAMHAGNSSVTDLGYISRANFPRMQAADKLNNAAHYEVVPRRILGTANFTFAGQTFVPAGATTSTGTTTPSLTPREQAVRAASEIFRKAWTVGLNLHNLFIDSFQNPANWNQDVSVRFSGVAAGTSFADSLPFWSKVEKLTIHQKSNIDPASSDASKHPVSIIDIVLSEGLIRKLSRAMNRMPQTEADAEALEKTHATAAERTAIAGNVNAERDLLLKLVLKHRVGQVTGGVSRDRRVVKRMARANTGDFSDMIVTRPPSSFP